MSAKCENDPSSCPDGLFCSINERRNVPGRARNLHEGSADRDRRQILIQKLRPRIKGWTGKRPYLTEGGTPGVPFPVSRQDFTLARKHSPSPRLLSFSSSA